MLNPGFELGVTRRTHTGQEFGEIYVPEGWVAFWREGMPVPHDPQNQVGYRRPEMKVIERVPPFLSPPRIHEGNKAVLIFTFYGIHDAGLYQNFFVTPGTRLRFSAWAHAWSSGQDDPFYSDLSGDSARNFTFTVGIDPTGATDPWSGSVVWGAGAHIYDQFSLIPVVEAVAQAATVTVFIRSQVLYPLKHCDAYIDTARLEVVEQVDPPEPPAPAGTTPYYLRESYAKTVHVPRQDCTLERWLEIAEIAYREHSTISGSADDALSHAPGQEATGVFYDLSLAEQAAYTAFRDTHYPGATVRFVDGEENGQTLPPVLPPVNLRPEGPAILLHWTPTTGAGVEDFVRNARPPAIKVVTAGGGGLELSLARQWRSQMLLVHRRVENGLNRFDPTQAAGFVNRYIQDLSPHFDLRDFTMPPIYIVSGNEWYECGAMGNNVAASVWDVALMDAIERSGLNLRGVVYTAPVGNPHATEADLMPLLPMVEKACAGGHLLGKHSYYPSVPDRPLLYQQTWEWYGGRFAKDDQIFNAHGLYPLWILGEGGACGAAVYESYAAAISMAPDALKPGRRWPNATAVVEYEGDQVRNVRPLSEMALSYAALHHTSAPSTVIALNPGLGWKYAGSIERYRDELLWCNAWYMNWNATHNDRLYGACLFTTGGGPEWQSYYLQGGDLDVITAAFAGG
ncbi:MAG: hypothetical protein JXR84_01135 [Anaerolineae bacterium]|nr:hypothetical protein [Anaerolineae bacterium]